MSISVQNNQESVQGLSGASGNQAIFNAELALGIVLSEGVQAQGVEASLEEAMSHTLLQGDVANAQSITKQLEKQSKHHFWHKVLSIAVDVAMGAFALSQFACGDVAGGVLAAAMLTANVTNGFSKAANGIATGLQKAFPNMPSSAAHIIADAIVIVAVVAASAGVGALGEGEAAAQEGSKEVAKEGEEESAKKGLSKTASSSLMGGSVATGELAPNLSYQLTEAAGLSGKSQKIVEGILTVMLELASAGGGIYAASSSVANVQDSLTIARAARIGTQGVEGGLKAGQGVINIFQGFTTLHLGQARSLVDLNNALNLFNNAMIEKTEEEMSEIVASFEGMLRNDNYFGGTEAVAQQIA